MTAHDPPLPQTEIDRLCELASVGARLASSAFGALVGRRVFHSAPRVCRPADPTEPNRWGTGVVFEAQGDLTGLVAIVLPEPVRDSAVALMLGEAEPRGAIVESALRELANIVASQTVSAIADSLDATILLSVPTLVMEDAGPVLRTLISQRGSRLRIETDLHEPGGALSALLVLAPDAPKPDAL